MIAPESDVYALVRKYRTMSGIRQGAIDKAPEILRALASEFPGALRELDCVSDEALASRLADVLGAARGDSLATWIGRMTAYHQLMRLVLTIRRHVLQAKARSEEPSGLSISARVEQELGVPCDPALVPQVSNPPAGRLNRLVFDVLSERLQCSADELEAELFPALAGQVLPATPHA